MKKKIFKTMLILIIFLILWIVWGNIHIQKTNVNIKNSKIPKAFDGYKIVEVADLHNHNWKDKLIDLIKEEKPDIIAITGDLIDSSRTDVDVAIDFVKKAKSISPIYYVTGNHEAWSREYPDLKQRLIDENVVILDDSRVFISKNGESIMLLGLQDPDFLRMYDGFGKDYTIQYKIENIISDDDKYKILLSHRPEIFDIYVKTKIDLVLSGHAHGGQVRIPFVGGLIAPNQGFFPKYTSGVYSKDQTSMVVSRGLGNSVIPVRINNTPELVVVTLNNQ